MINHLGLCGFMIDGVFCKLPEDHPGPHTSSEVMLQAEHADDEITDGMLRWEPGSLSTTTIERIATDALADLWRDCYRRGDNLQAFQRELFRQRVSDLIAAAAGEPFEVIKCPRIPKYPRGDAA